MILSFNIQYIILLGLCFTENIDKINIYFYAVLKEFNKEIMELYLNDVS